MIDLSCDVSYFLCPINLKKTSCHRLVFVAKVYKQKTQCFKIKFNKNE